MPFWYFFFFFFFFSFSWTFQVHWWISKVLWTNFKCHGKFACSSTEQQIIKAFRSWSGAKEMYAVTCDSPATNWKRHRNGWVIKEHFCVNLFFFLTLSSFQVCNSSLLFLCSVCLCWSSILKSFVYVLRKRKFFKIFVFLFKGIPKNDFDIKCIFENVAK